jgi:hypothetical protein
VTRELLAAAAGAIAAAVLVLELRPTPPPAPREITVDTLWLEQQRPELEKRSLGEKLTTKRIPPDQVAIASAPSMAGRLEVASYCAPLLATDSAQGAEPAGAVNQPQLPDFAGRRDGSRYTLFSTLGDGRRWQGTYTARGRVSWESSGDTVLVTGDRLWVRIARGAPKCGLWGAGGAAAGGLASRNLEGAIAAGAIAALSCAF